MMRFATISVILGEYYMLSIVAFIRPYNIYEDVAA
jgi:hypothetical protein